MRNGADSPSTEQLEIYRKAPDKLLMNFTTSGNGSSQAFNGATGWRRFNGRVSAIGGADLLGAKRDANFYKDINFKEQYPKAGCHRQRKGRRARSLRHRSDVRRNTSCQNDVRHPERKTLLRRAERASDSPVYGISNAARRASRSDGLHGLSKNKRAHVSVHRSLVSPAFNCYAKVCRN